MDHRIFHILDYLVPVNRMRVNNIDRRREPIDVER